MVELETITVKGFKSIASIEQLKLKPINVIIGPNGSGKSNFIDVFTFLHALREGRLQDYVIKAGGAEKILHYGSKVTDKIQIDISFRGGRNRYEIELQPTVADELIVQSEFIYSSDKSASDSKTIRSLLPFGREAAISDPKTQEIVTYVRTRLDSWRLYHFHDTGLTSPMKKTADINDNRYLRPDGSNLAAYLYYLREKHETSYSLILRTVKLVAPFFDDFILEPLKLNDKKIQLQWLHKGSDAYFDAASLSDGTLRFIALATLFLQPAVSRPSVILVDEPELGLHPYAINLLASIVKKAAVETQVILSTQSSLLLDQFEAEDVLVAERVDGSTQFSRLEPEKLAAMLQDYSLGQLWEKNEFGGRPRRE
ncbi:AAA family ATPase [Gloeobacter violaceus]|uniref:Gll1843 protein n=1 Tax=Gloeobacter violaceus (strain ATCC 29082 / PCC 7421) TaxID=251221 RepID=Q7NJI9_GLOVI|nr:AAA family ATPase [Gloeobacter violaceus]BAC89784.1 gll1843 [Gloeobacter violaceus PCC 7421]